MIQSLIEKLSRDIYEHEEEAVICPFHDDHSPSASLNYKKKTFYCFKCKIGCSFTNLKQRLKGNTETVVRNNERSRDTTLEKILRDRGLTLANIKKYFSVEVDEEFIWFKRGPMELGRRYKGTGPRYINKNKVNQLLNLNPGKLNHLWLVEGIFDAISLASLGLENVVLALGSSPSQEAIFASCRKQTVFLLFDNDYAGWKGSKETAKTILEVGGNPIILNLPKQWKDPADAHGKNKKELLQWLSAREEEFLANDVSYMKEFINHPDPLKVIPTKLSILDSLLEGGFKDGVHIIGGETGVGKTAFAVNFMELNCDKRILACSYEISKKQYWARLAGTRSKHSWSKIELNPSLIESSVRSWLRDIARNIRIIVGWNPAAIYHAAPNYDIVIIDYIQRMPGIYKTAEEGESSVKHNIRQVGDIARDHGKVVLVLSSLNRQGYGPGSLSSFKESGDIEYVAQTASLIKRGEVHLDFRKTALVWELHKNTRGFTGAFNILADLGHSKFEVQK